jgi:hypothetical protein
MPVSRKHIARSPSSASAVALKTMIGSRVTPKRAVVSVCGGLDHPLAALILDQRGAGL